MDYLKFVEEYKNEQELTLFDKVLVAAERAKDLSEGRTPAMEDIGDHKPTTIAVYEVTNKLIDVEIVEKTEDELDDYDLNDLDDDDDDD